MAAQTLDNVIAFNEARAARATSPGGSNPVHKRSVKPESVGMINVCRDMVMTRICAALASTFDKIEDELFELAGNSPDRETQNVYLDARTQAREKRPEIEAAFRSEFVSFFEKKVIGEQATARSADRFTMDQLSLVEDDALTENLAVNDIAKRLTNKCDEELRALSQRMGFLLSEPELADEANPIAPDTVIRALKAACDQLSAGFQTRLTVLRLVEHHMAQEMLSVYHDVNTHLVSQQVMPTLQPTFRRTQTQIVRKPASSRGGADQLPSEEAGSVNASVGAPEAGVSNSGPAPSGFGAYSAANLGMPPADQAVELFQTLQRLMAGGGSAASAEASAERYAGAQEYSSFTTGGFAPVPPRKSASAGEASIELHQGNAAHGAPSPASVTPVSSHQLVSALSQWQQHWQVSPVAGSATAAMRNFVPGETTSAELNLLREIKSQGVTEGTNQVDAMTIDIVAMLFDFVFDDKSIPDTIKALIARLQIPVLKVAIIDKTFFSKKSHPVRRLLDALAAASIAFAGEASRDDPLYKQIEAIVERIHDQFETDVSLFEETLVLFEGFLKARDVANAEVIEQSARAMHEREKREMARLIAQAEIQRHSIKKDLPAPVVSMLRGPWSRMLERVYLRDGGRSARFNEANDTAEQLVWSVQPKIDAGQRRDLVAALPLLLKRLQEGLDIAAVEKDERDQFFTMLVDCHAAAVKAGLRGESVAALFAAARGEAAVTPLFEKLIAEEREREQVAAANRSGIARIQFTDHGVEIEELVATPAGDSVSTIAMPAKVDASADQRKHASWSIDEFGDAPSPIAPPAPPIPPAELRRGTWVEFMQASGVRVRAKLSWVSPLKGVYLFTNPGAGEALSIAPDALNRQLSRGLARIIEESSLIDRAVDRMVSSLSDASA